MGQLARTIKDVRHWRRWKLAALVKAADEIPELIPKRRAILVGELGYAKWLVFDCPCREHHRVMLNLDDSRSPRWILGSGELLTVHPSVDAPSVRGRCHYFVRDGRIAWVRQRGRRR